MGGLLGVVGSVIGFTNLTYSIIYIIIGLIILQIGINLSGVSPKLSAYSIAMPSFLFKKLRSKTENLGEKFYATGIGGATFFVPCGFSMAAQLFAVTTGSFWQGSLVMLSFVLGSMIPLLGFGSISSFLKGAFGQVVFRVIAVFLVAIGAYNFTVGYTTLSSSISFETSAAAEEQGYESEYESLKLAIDGMFCISCVMRIESSLNSLDGVESSNVDLVNETADVEYDPEIISPDEITQADIFDDDLYSAEIID
ncbi:sulfite exporter TauE/SafE family protein [Candidatus Absconditicoccus praedator]|uniref:urease accessory protein UreH domain-containing protein n=1 Tax=Candidatus Absconditicoccus praedator TaxID=2735562 RepID=UPI001E3C1E37|nr:sulfite exporter TauE/SafE family protein [Candidatus Absconditicoccus praedator]UFX83223.1 sulfite exporter TauE/SafE family protein [Candidatus Absconditicoccus praedator]